jgi:hypothetical protein
VLSDSNTRDNEISAVSASPHPDRQHAFVWNPPAGPVEGNQNSWIYVPLLLDAAHLLHASAVSGWNQPGHSRAWWQQAVDHVLEYPRSDTAMPVDAMLTRSENEVHVYRQVISRHFAGQNQTSLTEAVGWACNSRGYIQAPIQDILLEFIGGMAFALELDRRTDAFPSAIVVEC